MGRFLGKNVMKSRIGLGWIPLLLFAFSPPGVQAQDIRVEASVNANRIGMDDDLQLTVSIYGDGLGRASAPTLPQHEGFRVAGQSQSTSIQWINGQMSATRAIIYRMTPVREGKHLIDSISVTYRGTEYLTEPIEVEVVSGSVLGAGGGASTRPPGRFDRFSPPRRRNTATGKVFVEAVLSSPSVYVGEQVILSYRLYTQVPIVGLDIDQRPQLTGFWVEEVQAARDPEPQETTIDGEMFYVFDINPKNVLFPTKAGEATIGPATFSMGVRASSDPFDSFFFRSTDTIRRASKPVTLEVKPLPSEGRPRNFSGAVGQYELGLEINKETVAAGDPLTVEVVVQGKGNLKTVEVPELPTPENFRAYDPKTEEKLSASPQGFGGEKRWEFVLVPSSPGRYQVGPLSFSYFDPATEQYVETSADPLTLEVEGAGALVGAPVTVPRSEVRLMQRDVRYLKPAPAELGAQRTPFYRSSLFYVTLALPLFWNLGLVAYRWKQDTEASQPGVFRRRRARREAHGRLKLAAKAAHGEAKDFYEVTAAALYRYVADKTAASHSGLTTQQIDTMLAERGVPEPTRKDYLETIEACEFARFTPGERTRQEMEELLERAEQTIVALDKHLG